MENKPLFTVIMPAFNAEKYISHTIESVLGQTEKNFEFIIIDDGSTDRTLEIINAYAQNDRRIRVISQKNKGVVDALNRCLSETRTELVARVDADDIALPRRFEKQLKFLKENEDHVIVGCQIRNISEDGVYGETDPRPTMHDNLKLFLGYGCALPGPGVMFRANVIRSVGGYSSATNGLAEDYECWTRIVNKFPEKKIANLPDVLYLYRINSRGATNTRRKELIARTIEVGDDFRKDTIRSGWKFLTWRRHKAWFDDLSHIDNLNEKESLKDIYFTIQFWFLKDIKKINPLSAKFLKFKLYLFTSIYNIGDLKKISNRPSSHVYPES